MAERMEYNNEGDTGIVTDDEIQGSDTYGGQTFTIGTTGENISFVLSSIDVVPMNESVVNDEDDLYFYIYNVDLDGDPIGESISSGKIAKEDITTSGKWINVPMTAVTLKKNTQYAFLAKSPSTSTNTKGYRLRGKDPGTYTGGKFLWTTNGGDSWIGTVDSMDCDFSINGGDYAGTLCTLSETITKAGANASTSSIIEPLVSQLVKQAEGVICSTTRYDWVNQYSSLDDNTKYILNQTASDLAAIYIITYDMSGYTNMVEAETMINIYRESALRGLSLLRNQEVKTFLGGT